MQGPSAHAYARSPNAYASPALPRIDDFTRDMEMNMIRERTTAYESAYDDWLHEVARMGGGSGGSDGSGDGRDSSSFYSNGGNGGYTENSGYGGSGGTDGGAAAAAQMDPSSVPLVPFVPPPGGWAYPGAPQFVPQDREAELFNVWSGRE